MNPWDVCYPLWEQGISLTVEAGEIVMKQLERELSDQQWQQAVEYAQAHKDEIIKLFDVEVTPAQCHTVCGKCRKATFKDGKLWCRVADKAVIDLSTCPGGVWLEKQPMELHITFVRDDSEVRQ